MEQSSYLMVVPVQAYPLSGERFEIESAFAEHLKLLKAKLGNVAWQLTIAGPLMSEETRARSGSLAVVDGKTDGIFFRPLFPETLGRVKFWLRLPKTLAKIYDEVRQSDIVHAGNSHLMRPFEFPALVMARALGKKTISVTDIDERQSAKMNYRTGNWSKKSYLLARSVYDPWFHLQQSFGVRAFSLVLLKGKKLAEDYGRGRPNVKQILDSAFSGHHVIPKSRLEQERERLLAGERRVEVLYFGRLVQYKGVADMLQAVKVAKDKGARLAFRIIGDGPEREPLEQLARELDLGDDVSFLGSIPFGPKLFERLYKSDILLAAPQSEDTPRSALDAFAAGMSIVAYDTYYYEELATMGAPVKVVPWLDAEALGSELAALAKDRKRLADQAHRAATFAQRNTQEEWLRKRVQWTRELLASPS